MTPEENNRRLLNFRPMLAAASGLAVGAAFCVWANGGFDAGNAPAYGAAMLTAFSIITAGAALFGAVKHKRWIFVTALFMLVGAIRVLVSVPDAISAGDCTVVGTVFDKEELPNAGGEIDIVLGNASCSGQRLRYRVLVRLPLSDAEGISVGDRLETHCTSVHAPGASSGTYNERLSRLASGISLKAYAIPGETRLTVENAAPLRAAADKLRRILLSTVNEVFGEKAGVVSAFLLGERDFVPEEVYDDMRTGGVAHIFSISGFHVGILTALLFFVLPKSRPVLRVILIGGFLLVYCSVTGFSPSIVRASLMCMCLLTASAVKRRADTLSSLSFSAIILMLINPFVLYSVGFRLSYSATLGIVLLASAGDRRSEGRFANKALSLFFATLGATAATVLIIARMFGCLYLYSLLSNLLCTPIYSAAIMLSFIVLLFGLAMPNAACLLASIPNMLIGLAERILRLLAGLPYARITTFAPSELSCLLMLVLLFSASGYVLRGHKQKLRIVIPVFAVFTASLIADIIRA